MGYAYSLGMIEVLKTKIKLGRYYIIAPENPGLGYIPKEFETVWHYGSDETKDDDDHIAKQNYIGFDNANDVYRARRPSELGWMDSHLIKNYDWIFGKTKTERGYVKKR